MKHKWKIVLGIVFAGVVALLIVFLNRGETIESITLSDGSEIRLVSITYGTNHLYRSPLAKLTQFLPDSLESALKKKFRKQIVMYNRSFKNPSVIFWAERIIPRGVELTGPENEFYGLSSQPIPQELSFTRLYENAIQFKADGQLLNDELSVPGRFVEAGRNPIIFDVQSVPKTVEVIELVFFEGRGIIWENEIGRFRFNNPGYEKPE